MNEKNVLMLCLSTFPKNAFENYYYGKTSNGRNVCIMGTYQLEVGTKYIISELSKQGRRIDRIIMLSTAETSNEEKEFDGKNTTAEKYYKEKIINFINQGEKLPIVDEDQIDYFKLKASKEEVAGLFKDSSCESSSLVDIYGVVDEDLFKCVTIQSGKEYQAVSEAAMLVKTLNEEKDTRVNLFVDLQGGIRMTTFGLNAVLNMLKHEDILAERYVATLFAVGNNINEIKDETEGMHIFDLVSAIDEFFSYGKGKKFCEYYERYEELKGNNNSSGYEKKIVSLIKDISEALELSNINDLEETIMQLIGLIRKDNAEIGDIEPIFATLKSNLEREYMKLLSDDGNSLDKVKVVEWCSKKELYQQALTLIEAKIPEAMVKDGILYYCRANDEAEYKEILCEYAKMYKNNRDNFKVWNMAHYFIKEWIKGANREEEYIKFLINDNTDIHTMNIPFRVYTDVQCGGDYSSVKKLINLYYELSDLRNKRNHAAEKSEKIDEEIINIRGSINEFLTLYEELRNKITGGPKSRLISWDEVKQEDAKYMMWNAFFTKLQRDIKKSSLKFEIFCNELKSNFANEGERGQLKSKELDCDEQYLRDVFIELKALYGQDGDKFKNYILKCVKDSTMISIEIKENGKTVDEICR